MPASPAPFSPPSPPPPPSLRRLLSRAVTATAAAAALIATAVPAHAATGSPTGPLSGPLSGPYVALGDSYASGAGVPNQGAGLCARSDRNYPSVIAQRAGITDVRDVTCGGAETKHMTGAQTYPVVGKVNDPQFDALSADTRLVTLTIGGNDMGFAEIVATCVALAATAPAGNPCKSHYDPGYWDWSWDRGLYWHEKDSIAERIDATAPKVAEIVRTIRVRAPHAKVLVVGYPHILPDDEWTCLGRQPMTVYDLAYLRSEIQRLDQMLSRQARANGATYVDTYGPTAGHDVCQDPANRWIEGVVPTRPAAPVHPNELGERAMAEAVLRALG